MPRLLMSDHVLVVEYSDGWEYSTACDHPSGRCDLAAHPAFAEMVDELGVYQPGVYPVRVVGDGLTVALEVVGG